MVPAVGRTRPSIIAIVVVLPAPLPPRSAVNEPCGTVKLISVDRDNVAIALDQALDRNGSARSIVLFGCSCHRVDNRVHLLSAIRLQGAGH
jgi:hypothetical protein